MSSFAPALSATCPSCGAVLVADRLPDGGKAICANCAHHFLFAPQGDRRRISRKAVASLVLAIVSLAFSVLTGIPAFVLGAWALFDIHRQEGQLRGRNFAMAGMILSVVCGFLSFFIWTAIVMFWRIDGV